MTSISGSTALSPPSARAIWTRAGSASSMVRAEREIVEQLAALPLMSPAAGLRRPGHAVGRRFPTPSPFRSIATARRRLFATPPLGRGRGQPRAAAGRLDGRQHRLEPGQPGHPGLDRLLAPGPGRAGGVARGPGRGLQRDRAALVRRGRACWSGIPARLALASALASLAYLAGSSPCAASWLSRPSGWPMRGSSADPRAVLAGLIAAPSTAAAEHRPSPTGSRAAAAGARVLGSRHRRPRRSAARARSPAPAAGDPAAGREGGPPSISSDLSQPTAVEDQLRKRASSPKPETSGSPCPAAPARLGDYSVGSTETHDRTRCWWCSGDADIYGRLMGNLVTVEGDVIVHPGRPGLRRHPDPGRRRARRGRGDRRRGPDAPLHDRLTRRRPPRPSRRRAPLETVFRRMAGVIGVFLTLARARLRAGDVRAAQPRSRLRYGVALVRPRLRRPACWARSCCCRPSACWSSG